MGGSGGGSSEVHHHHHQPVDPAFIARLDAELAASKAKTTALSAQLKAINDRIVKTAEEQKAKDAEYAVTQAAYQKHEAEKAAQEAAIEKRRAEEKARLDAIGMDHENNFNIALCGVSGSGKSTLNNALRKVRRGEPGYANTKAGAECTTVSAKYAHPQVPYLMLWDVPGGGTDAHPGATYFSDKCLDLFDFLVLCYDGRWSEVNTHIVREAARTGTSFVIAYTKTDNHVGNVVKESRGGVTAAAALLSLKRNVETDVSRRLMELGMPAFNIPIYMIDSFGIRDDSFQYDEKALLRAIVSSTALRLRKTPDDVWVAFQAAAPVFSDAA